MEMKKRILKVVPYVVVVTAVCATIYACTQQELSPGSKQADVVSAPGAMTSPYAKTVGAPIAGSLGRQWVANYAKATGGAVSYTIEARELQAILDRGVAGISLCYGVDAKGALHVLPLGVDSTGKFVRTEAVPVKGGTIGWNTSREWIGRHTGAVHSHYFGADTYAWLLKGLKGTAVKTTVAMNEKGVLQLLMSDAAVEQPETFADASYLCPPIGDCPREEVNQ
jgi:hypothetical protein